MPSIKSSADLRNHYNDISKQCHTYNEPVFITKNGKGDLAVMSVEAYEQMQGRLALYQEIADGLSDIQNQRIRPYEEAMADLRTRRHRHD